MHEFGQRILVGGSPGAGKTYVARSLADRMGLEYICNDTLFWEPNWAVKPMHERRRMFDEATARPGWTLDGNMCETDCPLDRMVLERADTLIWLDLPRESVLWGVLTRTFKRCWTGEELWHGNRETWRDAFASRQSIVWWSMRTYDMHRRRYRAIFQDPQWSHLRRIRLRSRDEIEAFLHDVGPEPSRDRRATRPERTEERPAVRGGSRRPTGLSDRITRHGTTTRPRSC